MIRWLRDRAGLSRVRARLPRRGVPLTLGGAALLALSAAAVAAGSARQDLVLTLAGIWGLLVGGLTGLATLAYAWRVRRDFLAVTPPARQRRLEGIEGHPVESTASVPRRGWPFVVEPEWAWIEPPGAVGPVADDRLRERVVPRSRWLASEIKIEIVVGDMFGLWRIRQRVRRRRDVLILPDVGRFTESEAAVCLASGDLIGDPRGPAAGDRIDHRPYSRSDPARLILWKVYARTRELLVRNPEPARTPDTKPIVYLVAGPGDDAAAGIARLLMESGMLGQEARFASDGAPDPVAERGAVRESLALSARHRHRGGEDLESTLAREDIAEDDPVILICPALEGAWIRPVLHQVARRPERFLVLAAADAATLRPETSGLQSLLWRPRTAPGHAEGVSTGSMLRACRPLVATGARVVLADRRTGRLTRLGDAGSGSEALGALAAAEASA